MKTGTARAATDEFSPPNPRTRRWVIIAAILVLCVHGALLLSTLTDWRVTLDSGYHVSLARAYGEHGLVPWDHINFGPAGRPNLQAPLMYMVIGGLGRAMGGTGGDYVLANAILAAIQWAAAMATAAFFALLLGGEWAMLLAAALLSGAGFAATSFAVGIPSGWLFILIPWAIHFLLRRRLALATISASAAIYVHIAGLVTAPLGIVVAAALSRRWRDLMFVGIATAIVTAPYSVHCLRYVDWFSGVRSYSALLFDPMLDVLGIVGLIAALRRPRDNALLVAWAAAPMAWLFQDPGRFILQSGLAASVLAAVWLAERLARLRDTRRTVCAAVIAAIATLCPFGVPALAAETAWAIGIRYPRAIHWKSAATLAGVIQHSGLAGQLVSDYQPSLCPAIAVYAPISCDKGHWVEVQPRIDPADALSAARKVYVLPLKSDDTALDAMTRRGWLRVWGGTTDSTVVTLAALAPLDAASAAVGRIVATEAAWLSSHAINNSFRGGDWMTMLSPAALQSHRAQLLEQRDRAGRIQLALIVYAHALEPDFPRQAVRMRRGARAFGVIASFLGDGLALDFETDEATARLKWRLGLLSSAAQSMGRQPPPDVEFERALSETLEVYLVTKGTTFAERPPENRLPWLSALPSAH
ncbi:MAG: hypothetical protein ACREPW_12100 [Candidatus Binataceae bacterium]